MTIDYFSTGDFIPQPHDGLLPQPQSELLEVAVTKNNVYLDEEDQRQYDESRKFIKSCPEYDPSNENNEKMIDWLELRNIRLTAESLRKAYECLFNGEDEPAVMSPKEFFEKVKPLSSLPSTLEKKHILESDILADYWNGQSIHSIAEKVASLADVIVQTQKEEKPANKVVAQMPTAWYAEVVEMHTERRIKDDTD
jgi:hypothetical protein